MNNSTAIPTNTQHAEPSIAERFREAYLHQAAQATPPSWSSRAKPWLIGLALGLAIGAGAAFAVQDQFAPLPGASLVRNGVIVIENDGSRAFLVSGWIVKIPNAPAPVQGQP